MGGSKGGMLSNLFSMLTGATAGAGAAHFIRDPKVNQTPAPKMDDNRDGFTELLNTLIQEEEKDNATLPPFNPNFPEETEGHF